MPFDRVIPRPLTTHGVRTFAPSSPGVYGISNAHKWIYIGDSENIQASLLEHLGDPKSLVMKSQPTGFICELCDRAAQPARLERLILEYGPACNRQSTSRYS